MLTPGLGSPGPFLSGHPPVTGDSRRNLRVGFRDVVFLVFTR